MLFCSPPCFCCTTYLSYNKSYGILLPQLLSWKFWQACHNPASLRFPLLLPNRRVVGIISYHHKISIYYCKLIITFLFLFVYLFVDFFIFPYNLIIAPFSHMPECYNRIYFIICIFGLKFYNCL